VKREEKRKWICLTYAGVYPSTKEVRHTTGKSTTSKTQKKPPNTGSISHTCSSLQKLRQNPEPESQQSIRNTKWVVNRQMPEMKWNGKHTFLGWWVVEAQRGGAQQRASNRASERESERRERRNYTTQKRAHVVETRSAAAGGRRKIRHHSRWAVYSFTAYKQTTS
jgi:hypothetical protein